MSDPKTIMRMTCLSAFRFFFKPTRFCSAAALLICLGPSQVAAHNFSVLAFSKPAGLRHDSITNGIHAIRMLATNNDFIVDATEDAAVFTDINLSNYQAIIFLNTTGDVLDTDEQAVFQRYIEAGGGFVGIHSASDTLHNWAWYGG